MKTKASASALIIVVLLFSTAVGMQLVKPAKANPESVIKYYIGISIESPENITYRTNQILLDVNAYTQLGALTPLTYVRYSVDGGSFIDFVNAANDTVLLDLPNGSHTIVAKARTLNSEIGLNMEVCANVTFTIDTTQPPTSSPSPPSSSSPTSTPSNEPQLTEQEIIIGVVIATAVIVAGLALLIYLMKRK